MSVATCKCDVYRSQKKVASLALFKVVVPVSSRMCMHHISYMQKINTLYFGHFFALVAYFFAHVTVYIGDIANYFGDDNFSQ